MKQVPKAMMDYSVTLLTGYVEHQFIHKLTDEFEPIPLQMDAAKGRSLQQQLKVFNGVVQRKAVPVYDIHIAIILAIDRSTEWSGLGLRWIPTPTPEPWQPTPQDSIEVEELPDGPLAGLQDKSPNPQAQGGREQHG